MSALHAYLGDDALNGWRDSAQEAGVSVTSALEAIGQALADGEFSLEPWVLTARRIDAERRRRNSSR